MLLLPCFVSGGGRGDLRRCFVVVTLFELFSIQVIQLWIIIKNNNL